MEVVGRCLWPANSGGAVDREDDGRRPEMVEVKTGATEITTENFIMISCDNLLANPQEACKCTQFNCASLFEQRCEVPRVGKLQI